MTIAACYVSHEGVILGADSSSTVFFADGGGYRHYTNAQKIFEIGEKGSTLGFASWGRVGLPGKSFRQLAAELSDDLIERPPSTVQECAQRWLDLLWPEWLNQLGNQYRDRFNELIAKPERTKDETEEMEEIWGRTFMGFCLGGRVQADRTPTAYVVRLDPRHAAPQPPEKVPENVPMFWGQPDMMGRLLNGIDNVLFSDVVASPRWKGTEDDFRALLQPYLLYANVQLPLREAIDWIFSSIFITIKAMKFYKKPQFCGGPIEVAVITADRPFRWVRHKRLDRALDDHLAQGGL